MQDYKQKNDEILNLKNKSYKKARFDKLHSAQNLFIFYAKQRSGHHVILDWMRFKFKESMYFNDPDIGKNFIDTSTKFWLNGQLYDNKELNSVPLIPKSVFINYENYFFDDNTTDNEEKMIQKSFVKRPRNIFRVLVIRDYLNNLASSIGDIHQTIYFYEMWINHAKEFFGETNFVNNPLYIIHFDSWVKNEWYRNVIQDQFFGEFDMPRHQHFKTSQHGEGSPFDKMSKKDDPFSMDLLNRHKTLSNKTVESFKKDSLLEKYSELLKC